MASATSPSTPSGGVNTSMWASQPPSKNGWGRGGEPGSTFRGGMGRGRPGRGVGSARGGGRGGRGGSRAAGPNSPRPDDKGSKPNGAQPKERPQSLTPAAPAAPITSVPTNDAPSSVLPKAPNQAKETKPRARKASEAKPPRKLPPIVIAPPPAAASSSPVSATTPNRSRRKRQSRSTSSISSKKSPSTESSSSYLRPEKSPVIAKDLPPHLAPHPPETPSFDIKHDIDALVERVRAVAMDRPNTPGSHIDWAGEDDDSLPDLDDWGVKSITDKSTSSSVPEHADLISPILAGALKPLPNIEGSPLVAPSTAPPPPGPTVPPAPPAPKEVRGDNTPRGVTTGSQKQMDRMSDASAKPTTSTPSSTAVSGATTKRLSPKQVAKPLHPSLPPKPVGAIDALTKRPPRMPLVSVQTPDLVDTIEPPPTSGLSESMRAPKSNGVSPQDQSNASSPEPEPQGAPALTMSVPSHIITHSTPSSFHPTHGRAHTIGRPGGIRVPFSASHASFLDGQSDERVSRRDRINHARTHSSPPTGPGTSTAHSRTVHASRPVITVDALSKLARTLGGGPAPKRESANVTATKD